MFNLSVTCMQTMANTHTHTRFILKKNIQLITYGITTQKLNSKELNLNYIYIVFIPCIISGPALQ